jgi:transposase
MEERIPATHPLRAIRTLVNEVLAALDSEFCKLYADSGRPSIAPERLLRALLLQAFYTIRSERQLMETGSGHADGRTCGVFRVPSTASSRGLTVRSDCPLR